MKIVYIIDSLASTGGVERIISDKMNYLSSLDSYEVTVMTIFQFSESKSNCYYLSDKVNQINLCIPSHLQYRYNYPIRLWLKLKYYYQLCDKISKTVNSIDPDIVIGLGYRTSDIACRIKCRAAKIFESHEARIYAMSGTLSKQKTLLSKLFFKSYRAWYLRVIEKHADVVVTLTREDAQQWQRAKRVEIIHNFSNLQIIKFSDSKPKRVIAVGRLEWQKRFDRLIDIWSLVSKKHPDWQLDIFGEGSLEAKLKKSIKEKGLNNILIHPFTKNISLEYATSSICVLTSEFEGFSLVLLEALRHRLPCVVFDCPYGPKDVIDHEECGFVIENGNINLFADKLCYLMDNPEIRKQFSMSAANKAQFYHVDAIMKQWKQLFDSLTTK